MTAITAYEPDIYADEAILDPYPHYAAMRALSPLIYLPKHDVFAIPRYAELKQVDRLEAAGYVCREKGRDRRSKALYLMPAGDTAFQMSLEMEAGLTPKISAPTNKTQSPPIVLIVLAKRCKGYSIKGLMI